MPETGRHGQESWCARRPAAIGGKKKEIGREKSIQRQAEREKEKEIGREKQREKERRSGGKGFPEAVREREKEKVIGREKSFQRAWQGEIPACLSTPSATPLSPPDLRAPSSYKAATQTLLGASVYWHTYYRVRLCL